ncbi:glycoside hydrolase family 38 C-terminal domain-containing protein [Dactylosporangium sp. NPDC048998]|uniref:glycoside hydrolase family 38 N-terminal domain-containing protein n=1 Tax=Dactylosporangium sp. NPDC048998 TaxID=3363976 RepID=UPI0037128337
MTDLATGPWTVWLIPHFHYDPVWWNTQSAYTQTWDQPQDDLQADGAARYAWPGHSAFSLVKAHLAKIREDPQYSVVLAEVDYLKPYWDTYPEDRELIRRLIADGRLELVGGTYNEPNTNLTGIETTIRNAVHGVGFQRHVVGGVPSTAWQLDVFGHDPQFAQVMAGAGLTSIAFARGPYHQWGPMLTSWNIREHRKPFAPTQFPTEFEWVSPGGDGLLTHYMAGHYSAGFSLDAAQDPQTAAAELHEMFTELRPAAATRNVLIPMGSDFSPPMRWVSELRAAWNERYPHVRLRYGLPRDFFAAVRGELAARGVHATPQTRDMNPIYSGKDVTAIDTKQAHRLVEALLLDAEKWATFATLHGAAYPAAAVDKAWRLLLFGAHHDAVTGTQSDQVYLDLIAGWREAHDLAADVDRSARRHLARHVDTRGEGTAVVVFNPLSHARTDTVGLEIELDPAMGVTLVDDGGVAVPYLTEAVTHSCDGQPGRALLRWVAHDVPSMGYRTYRLLPGAAELSASAWRPVEATSIANDRYRLRADPARGGTLTEITDLASGRDILPPGRVGNELVCFAEHRDHPEFGEGPWHLLPHAVVWRGAQIAADVTVERCPIGERITATAEIDGCRYTQHTTLWHGIDRIDFTTGIDGFAGTDRLLRVRVPCHIPGGMPVSETAAAVIGRGYALLDADAAEHPRTLDNTAHRWFGLAAALTVHLHDPQQRAERSRAVSIAEIVVPDGDQGVPSTRQLAVGLARAGVTATVTTATGNRYGALDTDSNLPDCRVAIGTPQRNEFVAELLDRTPAQAGAELAAQLAATGTARLWIPADRPIGEVWRPGADVRSIRDLPVLLIAGSDAQAEQRAVTELLDDVRDAHLHVTQPLALHHDETAVDDYAVALLNRGTPGFAVEPDGTLNMSLARACTGWPTGTAINFAELSAPGGRSFQHHTSRRFEYHLVSGPGGWRTAGFTAAGQSVNHPLAATVAPAAGGPLPATGSLLSVEPAENFVVTAVKPLGEPLATGSAAPADACDSLIVRGYEPHGHAGRVAIRLAGGIISAAATDLLDRPGAPLGHDGRQAYVDVEGYRITSLALSPARAERGRTALTASTEPVQPVFTRYWLHNCGPAPMGNLPVTLTLRPDDDEPRADGVVRLRAQIVCDDTDAGYDGNLLVKAPEGWIATPRSKPVTVTAGGHLSVPVTVTIPGTAAPGWYAIAASITHRGQDLEDVLIVPVGRPEQTQTEPLLRARSEAQELTLTPGGRGSVRVAVTHTLRTPLRGHAQLITPHHVWPLTSSPIRGFTVAPGHTESVEFPIAVPAATPPGEFWAQPKICAYGHIAYSQPIRIVVLAEEGGRRPDERDFRQLARQRG